MNLTPFHKQQIVQLSLRMRSLQYGLQIAYKYRDVECGTHQRPYSVDGDKVEEIFRIKDEICKITGFPRAVTEKWPV